MSAALPHRPSFIPSLAYKDNRAALEWLRDAFGFEPSEVLTDADGNIVHAEMTHGDGVVMIGAEWADWTRSPASLGGKNTQRVHVRIERGLDEHCAHARQAGARIVKEPEDQFYGERGERAVEVVCAHRSGANLKPVAFSISSFETARTGCENVQ